VVSKPIYVEILIRAPLDSLWSATQDPAQHQRWDLRFTGIEYLERGGAEAAQRFRYSTRIGLGIGISGEGETTAEVDKADGSRVSALRFWSADPKSLIKEGSGYWKYSPVEGGVRFVTWYDYSVRFGALGQIADRLVFRRLLGWATAWSFDRLRLWLEEGVAPEVSMRSAIAHHAGRAGVALCWIYQGVVPKLLDPDSGELEIVASMGVARGRARLLVTGSGVAETAAGVACIAFPRSRWPLIATLVTLPVVGVVAGRAQPRLFSRAFNPGSLSLAMGALCLAALATLSQTPSAQYCARKDPRVR
jgi:hypothetical protein